MGRKRKNKIYFGREVDVNIVEFNEEQDVEKKKQIYLTKIKPFTDQLILRVINTFKYYEIDHETTKSLQSECECYLYSRLWKFDPERGKSFSFLSIIVKNYLTQLSRAQTKSNQILAEISTIIETPFETTIEAPDEAIIRKEKYCYIVNYIEKSIPKLFCTEKDHIRKRNEDIAYSLLTILKQNNGELEFYNKKYVYALLRNMLPDEQTNHFMPCITKLTEIYKKACCKFEEM